MGGFGMQGAWTGADFDGRDDMKREEYTPCYIEANNSNPRDQHTRKLLENLRHVPLAILHGNLDELVPYSGVARQAERLAELGYRFRLYSFPSYEHYSHPVVDQWAEAARYEHSSGIRTRRGSRTSAIWPSRAPPSQFKQRVST